MTIYHYYTVAAGIYAGYVLGVMHAKQHTHWKNFVVAIVTGACWPMAVLYGAYLRHGSSPKG